MPLHRQVGGVIEKSLQSVGAITQVGPARLGRRYYRQSYCSGHWSDQLHVAWADASLRSHASGGV